MKIVFHANEPDTIRPNLKQKSVVNAVINICDCIKNKPSGVADQYMDVNTVIPAKRMDGSACCARDESCFLVFRNAAP